MISPTTEEQGLQYNVFFIIRDIKEKTSLSEASYFEFTVDVISLSDGAYEVEMP